MITERQKRKRKHEKELNSFRNKMGKNIVWFDSLDTNKQYDLLFEWKRENYQNKLKEPEMSNSRSFNRFSNRWEPIEILSYPPSLKHFIKEKKNSTKYKSSVDRVRETIIDILFNKKQLKKHENL